MRTDTMLCPMCFGKGKIIWDRTKLLCNECNGSGITYCCDGHQAEIVDDCPKESIHILPGNPRPEVYG